MTDDSIRHDVHKLGAALQRLGDALAEPETSNRYAEDTALAFVYVMSVCWKVVKELLNTRGIEARMPRDAVHYAHESGWIDDPNFWIQMLKDEYELSGGAYPRGTGRRLYPNIQAYYPELQRVHALMVERLLEPTEPALT